MKRIRDMYMSFRGIHNADVGALMTGMPQRQMAALSGKKETLPGRDGFLTTDAQYGAITVKQPLIVRDNARMADVRAWLNGSGELIFGDFPDLAYDATVMTAIPMSSPYPRLEGQAFTVAFTCQPFLHEVQEAKITVTSTGSFPGRGDVNSQPLVKVSGAGSALLAINGRSMLLTLTQDVPLYIDCDAGTAFIDGENEGEIQFAGERVTILDDWYELTPGQNAVELDSAVTSVVITPRWRYL